MSIGLKRHFKLPDGLFNPKKTRAEKFVNTSDSLTTNKIEIVTLHSIKKWFEKETHLYSTVFNAYCTRYRNI